MIIREIYKIHRFLPLANRVANNLSLEVHWTEEDFIATDDGAKLTHFYLAPDGTCQFECLKDALKVQLEVTLAKVNKYTEAYVLNVCLSADDAKMFSSKKIRVTQSVDVTHKVHESLKELKVKQTNAAKVSTSNSRKTACARNILEKFSTKYSNESNAISFGSMRGMKSSLHVNGHLFTTTFPEVKGKLVLELSTKVAGVNITVIGEKKAWELIQTIQRLVLLAESAA